MLCVDVNVLVYAHRPESPSHTAYRAWLDDARTGHEPLGLCDPVLASFVRVVTHPRVFAEPTPTRTALEFVEVLLESPAATRIAPGERHWAVFADLCRRVEATGNVVPDAYLAALAIEHGSEWITADRSFGRFPGLRWRHPLDG
jgi:hypothetical protein